MNSMTSRATCSFPIGFVMFLMLSSCQPDPDPEPSYCEFTFKGKSYRISQADYYTKPVLFGVSLDPYVSAESESGSKVPRLLLWPKSQEIFFGRDTIDVNAFQRGYSSTGTYFRNPSQITRNGNRFDFSGLLFHVEYLPDTTIATDGSQIEGHCVCRIR